VGVFIYFETNLDLFLVERMMIDLRHIKRCKRLWREDKQRIFCMFHIYFLKSLAHFFFFGSDFDDDEVSSTLEGQPSGLAATEVLSQTPAAANLLSGMSSNPLDDLVSIFGTNDAAGGFGGMQGLGGSSGGGGGVVDPLGELGGLSISGGGQAQTQTLKTGGPQPQQEDLLGLF
jgi:hypothetical protein